MSYEKDRVIGDMGSLLSVCSEAALCLICGNYFCCKMEYYYGESGECSRRHADKGGVSKLLAP